jgi:hypothetical protein
MISGSSKMSSDDSRADEGAIAFFGTTLDSTPGSFRFFFGGEFDKTSACEVFLLALEKVCDGSLVTIRDVLVTLALDTEALDSLLVLGAGCGIDWQSSVARLTPADKRKDFALGLGGGDGGGDGCLCGFCGFCTLWTAKSTFVRRFEALTGGDEARVGCLGVSIGFGLGRGIFTRGTLGVCTGSGF